jgi:2-(1,2-epoxy-1,2-dihydrophenyl)acetyl-CoA isomerase
MTDEAPLLYAPGTVATITFNRPGKKNALNAECWTLLAQALADFAADDQAKVLVITGAGGEFSSGADLAGGITGSAEAVASKLREVAAIILAIHESSKPTIASVPGVAAGVGLSIALCCDLVVASSSARFGAVFSRVGLTPDGGSSWLLPRLVGPARAKELVLTGRMVDAVEAERIGLVNAVVADTDLADHTATLAERVAQCSPVAASEGLRLLDRAWTSTFAEALADEADAQQKAVAARNQ